MSKPLRIGILGSTGSIGKNSIEVIRNLITNGVNCKIEFLTTNNNVELLKLQAKEFNPSAVVIANSNVSKIQIPGAKIYYGEEGLLRVTAEADYDVLLSSLVGFAGLAPTIEAIRRGKRIALANKETLVVAGGTITELAKKFNSELIPVDSEHSAIFQCLTGESQHCVDNLILTASGGPFRNRKLEDIVNASIEDALNHPNWNMGNKITIDSATLMNKGLEVIEAHWLFNIPPEKINVVIHPQSIIHSMVEFNDGSIKAQMGIPDMKIPIQYALTFPERVTSDFPRMDFEKFSTLSFEKPDTEKFRCLNICYDVLKLGGTYPVVLNAANEIAISLFLDSKISFGEIADVIEQSLEDHVCNGDYSLDNIFEIDKEIRNKILRNHIK
ncbi:MAG: 1-deoxy-D-xylulose-5-phosphate reductoisomerase [Ignavibacteriaceae bacterium]|jgi:1-deoxy-D-xylulose 5-phosphate reductoisomerase (EC 1.1.1.267)|nr:MAG: 1-deoxy-D-xylulose 5-phosphate reductoisomerase [Chlorobi bacterium OLB4]MBV6399454.1 1-deoxy-D-xylulose 5-phosphate reductoisomerase [Ignavibacteria bacterium]MCC6886702.1 1-deoxy-D-xylulose-5-phosphate reductoisomerase [Ignavibacteriales bacterium]MCE7953159.1 1-deoxy-D-xylulose-5-phosphate reductoisomerase [Chlorobi bacterium CHB7]MEB2329058.1 1-deoxy-D-xylulose-5-phosphate reductoisomerase [Ignavibacteriaceae bacterium]OQY76593.1 MAG: 1-deoxy-D-xylulose-5-phosphate reductoisomerase